MTSDKSTAAVRALFDRYLIGLDDDTIDEAWTRGFFTEDARIEFSLSGHQGLDGMAQYHRDSAAMFAQTQHLNSPAVVDLVDDDHAVLRSNLISTHVHHPGTAPEPVFTAGVLATAQARRTPEGWRLASLAYRVVWTKGTPPRPQQP